MAARPPVGPPTGRLFGTDGVRGLANGVLTAELALELAVAAAHVLPGHEAGGADQDRAAEHGSRPLAVVGRDTRVSGHFLEAAVVAGLTSSGVDVLLAGELPTPGVAWLTDHTGADFGVMISASHNPMPDNGIKFFARGGRKLADHLEDAVESAVREHRAQDWSRPTGGAVGRARVQAGVVEAYAEHLLATVGGRLGARSAAGTSDRPVRVVLDCAHGAAWRVGPLTLAAAGADVVPVCDAPDGLNINAGCGSTHLEVLAKAVVEQDADLGFALDGDADRVLAVDATGEVVDGDQLMAILALSLHDAGELPEDTVVATVMSNLGFLHAMAAAGITVRQAAVGDRYVLEEMNASGLGLGGEQSGHVIISRHATTGDGLLAALQVLDRMTATGRSLAELAGVVTRLPQVLVNVPDVDKTRTDDPVLAAAVAEVERELGDEGRVLLRPSGTEPLVRVMVEATTAERAREVAERLADVVRQRLSSA